MSRSQRKVGNAAVAKRQIARHRRGEPDSPKTLEDDSVLAVLEADFSDSDGDAAGGLLTGIALGIVLWALLGGLAYVLIWGS
jgi:hypothetical protein